MMSRNRRLPAVALLIAGALLLAGCASADKNQSMNTTAMNTTTTTAKSNPTGPMAGMNMGSSTVASEVPSVNGIKPVASQVLATTDWEGMQIQARTMTPVKFVIFNGTTEKLVKPPKNTSFHLMVMLNDEHTGFAIPYAGVWATILNSARKVVYSEVQLPMLSAYMGPHYGNNVSLPGPGHYTLQLLISPPVAARHMEYAGVWLKPHRVTESFTWNPTS
jgi:uncharacterized protein involved in high-affinity Fe2+ transport